MVENKGLLTIDDAIALTRGDIKNTYKKHMNPALSNLLGLLNYDKKYVRAEGTAVWDDEGNRYLDFLGGYGSLNLGHNHEEVIAAIDKVKEMPNLLQASMNPITTALAYNLSVICPGNLSNFFFCNSGAEAVEGAIKIAKIYSGKNKIIYFEGSFHGKTTGALAVTGRSKYQLPFSPLMPECIPLPFGDLHTLEEALKNKEVACVIIEPIQGEGGIIVPKQGYLSSVSALCSKYDALLVLDEVQTGFGRTGKMFAAEWEHVAPDILCMAKSLGGGIMPIGAFATTKDVWLGAYGTTERATLHTSTFGGNTWAAAAAMATIQILIRDDLAKEAEEKGNYFIRCLNDLKTKHSFIKEVRGRGLLIGLELRQEKSMLDRLSKGKFSELSQEYTGALVAGELFNAYGIITAYTFNNPNVIRLEPPLTVSMTDIDYVVDSLDKVFASNKNLTKLAFNTSKSILGGLIKR